MNSQIGIFYDNPQDMSRDDIYPILYFTWCSTFGRKIKGHFLQYSMLNEKYLALCLQPDIVPGEQETKIPIKYL